MIKRRYFYTAETTDDSGAGMNGVVMVKSFTPDPWGALDKILEDMEEATGKNRSEIKITQFNRV